jgi:hypothetical protein
MRLHTLIAACTMLAASLFTTAQAAPITYTVTGNLSGELDFTPISNAAFTWTITSDTSLLKTLGQGGHGRPALTESLTIAGFGTLTPVDQIFAEAAPLFHSFVFTDNSEEAGIGFNAPQLGSYDGLTSIGPLPVSLSGTSLLTTAQGTIFFESVSDMLFEATTAPAVPEPISITLVCAGLAGIGFLSRRRRALA